MVICYYFLYNISIRDIVNWIYFFLEIFFWRYYGWRYFDLSPEQLAKDKEAWQDVVEAAMGLHDLEKAKKKKIKNK